MKNKLFFTRSLGLKLTVILFALLLYSGGSWATVVTHTFSATSGTIDPNISFACQQNSSSTAPAFNTNLRLYFASTGNGCSITLTPSNGAIINEVKITAVSTYTPTVKYNVDGGSDATASLATLTYTITGISASSSLKIRNGNTTNTQLRITAIEVTYTPLSAPTTQAHDIAFSNVSTTAMKIDWTNGNGSSRTVFVKETAGVISNPVDGTTYTASADWNSKGTQLETSGYYCVYNGTGATVTLTNLVAGTAYYVQVFEYNGTGATSKYYIATATGNPNNQSTSAASSPTITIVGTINAFTSTVINTTSTEQNYTVEGSNLTDNIIITPPVGFEISKSTGSGFVANPSTLSFTPAEVATPQTVYVRFAPTAAQAYSGSITNTSTDATQQDKVVSGTGIKAEPTSHVTFFDAVTGTPSYSAIIVSWTDATGSVVPDGYLVKGSNVGYSSITDPVDGTAEGDGGLVKNIAKEIEIFEFTGLSASTPYYFKIYPYTNSGSTINYKMDPTIPEATATTDAQPVLTYTWNVASGNWNTAASWTPARTFPATSDILIFDGTTQTSPTVTLDFTTPQSVGRLRIINNAKVTFGTSSATRTLNIGYTGTTSPQFEITSGSSLTVGAANAITLNVTTGFTGSISGSITFQNAAHRLTAADASGVTLNSGATFTAGAGFSGNAFGTTPYNTIVFANGSTYNHEAGSNPFGASQPNSVVVFQTGSTYKQKVNSAPSLNGRSYSNFEVDVAAFSQSFTGAAGVTMDNLTLTNSTLVGMNLTGAMNIKGNITVNSGTLSFSPASLTNVNLNGTSTQTISGNGTLTISPNASFVIDNTVIADRNIAFGGSLTINAGKSLIINAGKQLTVTGTLTNTAGNSGLVIKSDATGTGSLITSSSPSATVERYITGAASAWHLLSSPVSVQAIEPEFVPVQTPTPTTTEDFFTWYEPTSAWVNYKNTSTAPTWNTANGSTNFVPGKGYLVEYQAVNPTKTFTGTLNAGAVNFPMTAAVSGTYAKTNLAGNPYPSSIDWKSVSGWDKSNVQVETGGGHSFYTWNETDNNYGAYNDESVTDNGTNGVNRQIAPMQGFFIKAASAGSLSMTDAVRVHSSQAWLKSGNEGFRLKVTAPENKGSDEISFEFGHSTSVGGAAKWNSFVATAPSLSTPKSGTEYSISFLESLSNETVIPVTFRAGIDGQYTLAADLQSLPEAHMYLVDNKLSKTQNLSDNPVYTFAASTTDEPNRFKLTFKSVGVNESSVEQPFNIYATNNTVYVANTSAASAKGEVFVYNTLGQVIAHQNLNGDLTKINIAATGYYLVKVVTKSTIFTGRVFVQQQ
jgi:hypothetical protein